MVIQTLEPNSVVQGDTGSTCNNDANNAVESAATDVCDEDREKTLEFAEELTEKGYQFLKSNEFAEAVDCFSRALEIRVEHYGELSAECINAYYQYGSALLEKAQSETDPLGNIPKKEAEIQQKSSNKDESLKNTSESCFHDDEDESDLDMAWKILDIARAITEKQSTDIIEKVDILCALAEISLEREDIESSFSDYKKALSILEQLVEPESRHIAEINFRICICLETGFQPQEAIPYCQKAISICKSQIEKLLTKEINGVSCSATSSTMFEKEESIQESSYIGKEEDKETEIGVLVGLAIDLGRKLADLKQQAENPKKRLVELMRIPNGKAVVATGEVSSSSRMGNVISGIDLDSPTGSTTSTSTGVVGRGVKRVLMNQNSAESSPLKKKLAPQA